MTDKAQVGKIYISPKTMEGLVAIARQNGDPIPEIENHLCPNCHQESIIVFIDENNRLTEEQTESFKSDGLIIHLKRTKFSCPQCQREVVI